MISFKWMQGAAVALATLGTMIPNAPVLAAGPTMAAKPAIKTVNAKVFDITLAKGGTFKGRVVDHTGAPLEGAEVAVRQGRKEVGRSVTDKTGSFTVSNLNTGIYSVASGNTEGTYRMWSENAAPPSAKEQGLLVMGQNGARGNFGYSDGNGMLIVGAIAAATLGVGIAALVEAQEVEKQNANNNNATQAELAAIQKQLKKIEAEIASIPHSP